MNIPVNQINIMHVADLSTPLPGHIYLDTSFVYEIYGNNPENRHSQDCFEFTNRLAGNKVPMIISSLVKIELEHVIMKGVYNKHAKLLGTSWWDLKDDTDRYMPEVNTEIDRVFSLIDNHKGIISVDFDANEIFDQERTALIKTYSLDSMDAGHLVVAVRAAETNSIATVDKHFARVPNLNLYTPTESILVPRARKNTLVPLPEELVPGLQIKGDAASTKEDGS